MRITGLILAAAICGSAQADWQLSNDASSLHFISTKNEHIAEIHSFKQLSGSLSDAGELKVEVKLDSVDTGIGIRDQRMRDMLFSVADLPTANLSATLDKSLLDLTAGSSRVVTLDANFTINQNTKTLPVTVRVTKLKDNTLVADTVKPLLVNANDFKLAGGVGALQKVAGLSSISLTVPLSFNVTFVAN